MLIAVRYEYIEDREGNTQQVLSDIRIFPNQRAWLAFIDKSGNYGWHLVTEND